MGSGIVGTGRKAGIRLSLLSAAVSCLLLWGCPNAVQPGPESVGGQKAGAPTPVTAPVDLSLSPSAPRAYTPTTFTVRAHPDPGPGAVVTIELTMPSMRMPPTRVQTHSAGQGNYTGQGAFSMPGTWHAEITLSARGKESKKIVAVDVK